jgi:hypothetical protein
MTVRETLLGPPTTDPTGPLFLALAGAARLFPGEQPDQGVSPNTVYRWGTRGIRLPDGRVLKLRLWRIGRKWVTTRAALAEFIDGQQPSGATEPLSTPRTPSHRIRACEAASEELRAVGV